MPQLPETPRWRLHHAVDRLHPPMSVKAHPGASTGRDCLTSNETGHPAEVRWALYGPLSHAPMRIASRELFAIL